MFLQHDGEDIWATEIAFLGMRKGFVECINELDWKSTGSSITTVHRHVPKRGGGGGGDDLGNNYDSWGKKTIK